MKKSYFLVILASLLLLTLSACSGPQGMTEQGANYVVTDKDNQLFEKGTEKLDLDYCNDITDKKLRTDCTNIVKSKQLQSEALETNDEKVCNQIKIVEYKNLCVKTVKDKKAEEANKQAEIEKSTKLLQEAVNQAQKAGDSGDIKKCQELKDPELKISCEDRIYFKSKTCNKIQDPILRADCK